jgi:hypothetical protein
VGDTPHQTPTPRESADLERRQFLRRAAVAGAVWAVPTVIAIKPASAAGLHSAPPPKPVDHVPTGIDPVAAPAPPRRTSPTELAFTGADVEDLTVAGLAVTAAGAALLFLSGEGAVDEAITPRTPQD